MYFLQRLRYCTTIVNQSEQVQDVAMDTYETTTVCFPDQGISNQYYLSGF